MYYFRIIFIATKSLFDEFGRTFISLLGIIISVISIMTVITLGAIVDRYIQDAVGAFGTDTIQVEIQVPGDGIAVNISSAPTRASIDTLIPEDARALEKIPSVAATTLGLVSQARMVYGGESKQALLLGSDHNAPLVDQAVKIAEGRFMTKEEAIGKGHVLVLGSQLAEKLFGTISPVEERVRLNGTTYRVIGVLEDRGSLFGFNFDDLAYIPYSALTKEILGQDHVTYITVKAVDAQAVTQTADEVRSLLRLRHDSAGPDYDDFVVTTTQEAQDLLGNIVGTVSLLLVALASVSIIVGGVGIMNMMLMSVEERKSEIGLRKAIGATRSDIQAQFLVESVVISVFAAIIGIIISIVLLWTAATLAVNNGFVFTFIIPPNAIIISAGFSIAAGVLFGFYPARIASKTDPVAAMR